MNKKRDSEPPSKISRVKSSVMNGLEIEHTTITKGIVKFSTSQAVGDNRPQPRNQQSAHLGLHWQTYSELGSDHGFGAAYGVLFDNKNFDVPPEDFEALLAIFRQTSDQIQYDRLIAHIEHINQMTFQEVLLDENSVEHSLNFLRAAWADEYSEPFSPVWLAAMALYAYYVEENDFAFGYLTAILDQKLANEADFLRGKRTVESAKQGGEMRSAIHSNRTRAVLSEMKRLIDAGQPVSNAAGRAYSNGFGSSTEANRKLWNRHRQKKLERMIKQQNGV